MTLTYRAIYNALAGFLDHMARVVVGFVITPVLVSSMGASVFGVWQVLFRLYNQLAPLDGRSAELLKWQLANLQEDDDVVRKKVLIGSAFLSFLSFLPFLIFAYFLCIYFFDSFVDLDGLSKTEVVWALVILALNSVLISISLHSEAVLRGANLFYKVMGLKPIILIIGGGGVTGFAVYSGYGVIGAAVGQLVIGILSVPLLYVAMKRLQPWFGVLKPDFSQYKLFMGRCKWFTLWEFLSVWMIAGEVVVLAWLASAKDVAVYTLTMYAMQMLAIVVLTAVSSAMPGMGGLIGKGEFTRVSNIRKESLLYSALLSIVLSGVLVVFNKSFVTLWVGAEYYSGYLENILIILCSFQMIFIKHDAFMLNMALDIKSKVLIGFVSLITSFALMYFLIPRYNILGLCVSLLLGRGILSIAYPMIIKKFMGVPREKSLPVRIIIVSVTVFIFLAFFSREYMVYTWVDLIWQSILLSFLLSITIFYLGFDARGRMQAISRIQSFLFKS